MTIVAWDGRYVAADSLACLDNNRLPEPESKFIVRERRVYACVGSARLFRVLIDWYEDEANPAEVPCGPPGSETGLIIFEDGCCINISTDFPYPEAMPSPCTWGWGSDIALGAMDAGCDAKRAVEIAIARNIYLGGPVEVIDLHELQQKADAA